MQRIPSGNIDELVMVIENSFRHQLMRLGHMTWDDFISPLLSVLKDVNDNINGAENNLLFLAPLVRDAMHTAQKMLLEMEERRRGRYGRQPHEEELMTTQGKAIISCLRRDMDVRFAEIASDSMTIEYGLQKITANGVDRNASSYSRMIAAIERWCEQINALYAVPTSGMQTADYLEKRFGAKILQSGEIPPWVDQTILNIIITSILQYQSNDGIIFHQREGGVLVASYENMMHGMNSLRTWNLEKRIKDVRFLIDYLCERSCSEKEPSLMYASKVGCGSRFSIVWDEACEFNSIPHGWHVVRYSQSDAIDDRSIRLAGDYEKQAHLLEGVVQS